VFVVSGLEREREVKGGGGEETKALEASLCSFCWMTTPFFGGKTEITDN